MNSSLSLEHYLTRKILNMNIWECEYCGFIYSEEEGAPEEGIAPGTKWEDIPEDWCCPECGVTKSDFKMRKVA